MTAQKDTIYWVAPGVMVWKIKGYERISIRDFNFKDTEITFDNDEIDNLIDALTQIRDEIKK